VPDARELVLEATHWVLLQTRPYHNGSKFGHSFVTDPLHEPDGSRIAWCYGDLGIAAALLITSRHCARADLGPFALELARGAARRPVEDSRVTDAGLCHGAFGNAHVFGRLHAATREPCLLEAATRWLAAGLAMRQPGRGLAGFRAWQPLLPGEPARDLWQESASLLEGTAGIGLVLLGYLTSVEPAWDEFLMLDLPGMKS
jgi:hypothetical protein